MMHTDFSETFCNVINRLHDHHKNEIKKQKTQGKHDTTLSEKATFKLFATALDACYCQKTSHVLLSPLRYDPQSN